MPLVRISLPATAARWSRSRISEAVHRALVEAVGIPPDDRFQVISAHAAEDLIFDPSYLGVSRSVSFMVVEITLRRGRSPAQKRALYRAIVNNVHAATGARVEDIMIVLHENDPADWSFGAGVAQYAPAE